jgi:hypothetical protein
MKNKKIKLTGLALIMAFSSFAGNKDRSGQSAAGELLINPWGLSSGLFGLNSAYVSGVEAMKCNIAGLSKTEGSEFGLAHTRYLAGTGLGISNLGMASNLGNDLVIGVNLMSFTFGTIPITTENSPEGGIGSYRPNFINVSLGLAKKFSDNMSTGIQATYINESITNIRASAVGFDAGVQYVNGQHNNLHIGVTLRNVGTNIRFQGDGFSYSGTSPDLTHAITVKSQSDKFALPSQLNFGLAYDFYLKAGSDTTELEDGEAPSKHRLTPMFSFISNAFSRDWIGVGVEYAYKEKFMGRLAYRYEGQITSSTDNSTMYTGLSGGLTFATKMNSRENAKKIMIDYGFRATRISNGVHTLGIRMGLGKQGDKK